MYNGRPHPYLAQIPLTVSPFISLPSASTLPYTYKSLPSKLPPSSTADASGLEQKNYVVSESGYNAHPDEIIASCQALQAHIQKLQEDAEQTLKDWQARIQEQDLAEKRRVAPGWLDRDEKILEPARSGHGAGPAPGNNQNQVDNIMDLQDDSRNEGSEAEVLTTAGDELDRAFGGMVIRNE